MISFRVEITPSFRWITPNYVRYGMKNHSSLSEYKGIGRLLFAFELRLILLFLILRILGMHCYCGAAFSIHFSFGYMFLN